MIVEGEVTEVEVFNRIGNLFFDRKTKLNFYPYKSNLYSLYQKIEEYEEMTSTIEILKEIAPNKKSRSILNKNFSEIYLIFDFDPQESAYSDSKIKKLALRFNNETEFGKLYINYPMMESMRDHHNFDINEYLQKRVQLQGLSSESYKFHISHNGYNKPTTKMTIKHFKLLTKMNVIKANNILTDSKVLPEYSQYQDISNQINILLKQIEEKNKSRSFYVLNTCMFFIIDYFGQKIFKDIKKV